VRSRYCLYICNAPGVLAADFQDYVMGHLSDRQIVGASELHELPAITTPVPRDLPGPQLPAPIVAADASAP
jgi:hypothetical protein